MAPRGPKWPQGAPWGPKGAPRVAPLYFPLLSLRGALGPYVAPCVLCDAGVNSEEPQAWKDFKKANGLPEELTRTLQHDCGVHTVPAYIALAGCPAAHISPLPWGPHGPHMGQNFPPGGHMGPLGP